MTTDNPKQTVSLEEWMEQLRSVALIEFGYSPEATATMRDKDWHDYWRDGYTPADALQEDSSYA